MYTVKLCSTGTFIRFWFKTDFWVEHSCVYVFLFLFDIYTHSTLIPYTRLGFRSYNMNGLRQNTSNNSTTIRNVPLVFAFWVNKAHKFTFKWNQHEHIILTVIVIITSVLGSEKKIEKKTNNKNISNNETKLTLTLSHSVQSIDKNHTSSIRFEFDCKFFKVKIF